MGVEITAVKRRYDGAGRRTRAEQVRETLLDTAREMLLADGYAAATIPRLARACGVSPESVYKRFPGKPALVRAVVTRALHGSGAVPAETRSDALPDDDLDSLLRGWGRLAAEVAPRVAPVLLLVHAAAAQDAHLAALDAELDQQRRTRMTGNARRLALAGYLPPGVTTAQVADVLWTYSSPQLYRLLVLCSTWDLDGYADFIVRGVGAHLRP